MQYSAIPLFKTHYSLGKSILTLTSENESSEDEPSSVFDLVKYLKLDSVTLVEDSMSGFLEAYKSSEKRNLQLQYGLRITICSNIENKTTESRAKEYKLIVFAKNTKGYSDLIKISTTACFEGFYYYPRIDMLSLKKLWSDNLVLAVPFYDSFVYKNNFTYSICVPEFSFCDPIFFTEDNNLPMDRLLANKVADYTKDKHEVYKTQSIYYESKEDFLSYLTFRCISKRTTLNKPNLEHCSSNEFCAEAFKEKYGQ